MTYFAATVANSFLELADSSKRKLTHLQLQKLMYFAHGWHLALLDKPLVNEPFVALQNGPVLPSIQVEFSQFANDPIPNGYKVAITNTDEAMPLITVDSVPLSDEKASNIIQFVWDKYSPLDGVKLSAMTHEDRASLVAPETGVRNPWRKNWRIALTEGLIKKEIPNSDIKDYFKILETHRKLF